MNASSLLFVCFVLVAVGIALIERLYAARNEKRLLRAGGRRIAQALYRIMLPAYAAIFPLSVIEFFGLRRHPPVPWMVAMIALFLGAKVLKLWVVLQLRRQWTMNVVIPVELHVVTTGPYRYVRHPNYVAVMVEVVALPLAGGAWITALAGGLAFMGLLRARVRAEEAALFEHHAYATTLASKPRYLPRGKGK